MKAQRRSEVYAVDHHDPHTGAPTKCFSLGIHEGGAWKRLYPATGLDCETGDVIKFK